MDDEKILELFAEHNPQAIQEAQNQYGAALKRLAFRFLGNEADAEECLNDVWFKAWNVLQTQKPEHLSAYLMQICRYTAFNMLDQKTAQKRNAVVVELTAEMEQCIPDDAAQETQTELSEILNEFLKSLSKEKRIIFVRRYWYGDSIAEIAQALHCREGKVKTSLCRSRKKLEKYLKERGVSYERKEFAQVHDSY